MAIQMKNSRNLRASPAPLHLLTPDVRTGATQDGVLALLALLLLALVLASCDPVTLPSGGPEVAPSLDGLTPARVRWVVDGDTIQVSIDGQDYSLRYIGIDTPETWEPIEWMGPEATAANEALVGGQTVYLEKDVSETDRYGRL